MVIVGSNNFHSYVSNQIKFYGIDSKIFKNLQYFEKSFSFLKEADYIYNLNLCLKNIICVHKPDVILYDISRAKIYQTVALELNIPAIAIQTYAGLPFNIRIPPSSSFASIAETNLDCALNILTWLKRIIRRVYFKNVNFIRHFFYPHNKLRCIKNKLGLKWRYNFEGRYLDTTIFLLGPKFLEFPESKLSESIEYLGLCVNEFRKFNSLTLELEKFIHGRNNLVYCCFGTMDLRYKNDVKKICSYLIDIFKKNRNYSLILCVNSNIVDYDEFNYENIFVGENLPQLEVIKKSSTVICHGGFGTIKETLYYNKSLIVIPFIFDQLGHDPRRAC